MKIIMNKSVYIQKIDLSYLRKTFSQIPEKIRPKIFKPEYMNITENNKFEFIKYEEKDIIKFLTHNKEIYNYYDVKEQSEQDVIKQCEQVLNEYKNKTNKEKDSLLEYKMNSLKNILYIKRGLIEVQLPEEVINSMEKGKEKKKKK